ncbi:MAG: helix-turn-helix domain-containing protein, partial [candidate division WOR-3 bacterium]|nr:helix-turn-helix domain-containing protein [candidate division WOR-3 bacterium]
LKLTMKEHNRHEIMEKVMNKEMKLTQAAELMGVKYRQAIRIKKRYEEEGVRGLIRKEGSGRKGFSESFRKSIVYLYNKHYNDLWHPTNIEQIPDELRIISFPMKKPILSFRIILLTITMSGLLLTIIVLPHSVN